MGQIFKSSVDTWVRIAFVAMALGLTALAVAGAVAARSSFETHVGWPVRQPVPFSHEHHVGGLGLDCRFCHAAVESGRHASLPATRVCMNCHSQVWTDAPMLEPVRASLASGQPLHWQRVAQLPGYVYFDHSIHIDRGVACHSCHGDVSRMPLLARAKPFEMRFCLDCHRDPAGRLEPRDNLTAAAPPAWDRETHQRFARGMAERFHLQPARLDQCDICHR